MILVPEWMGRLSDAVAELHQYCTVYAHFAGKTVLTGSGIIW